MEPTIVVAVIAAVAAIIAASIGLIKRKTDATSGISAPNVSHTGNVTAGRDAWVAGRDINLADDRKTRSERKTDEGRKAVQEWGKNVNPSGWGQQAWHDLGFALQSAHEALEIDPNYQRAWTLLADIYHRIGRADLAKKCLEKSYSLATPGPNHPGRFYKQVKSNIESGYPFNRSGGLVRESPPLWFEEKYQRYWTL